MNKFCKNIFYCAQTATIMHVVQRGEMYVNKPLHNLYNFDGEIMRKGRTWKIGKEMGNVEREVVKVKCDGTVSATCQIVDFGISALETSGSAFRQLFSDLPCSCYLLLYQVPTTFFFYSSSLPFNFQFTSTFFPLQLRYHQCYDSYVPEVRMLCHVLSYLAYLFAVHFLSLYLSFLLHSTSSVFQ